jgi:hypothetical protein
LRTPGIAGFHQISAKLADPRPSRTAASNL